MPYEPTDPSIRAQLHIDIESAWGPLKAIHDSPPELDARVADLPRAFIINSNVPGVQGIVDVEETNTYTIQGQWPWPAGASIYDEQMQRIRELVRILVAVPDRYAGSDSYEYLGFDTGETTIEETEPIYTVTIRFKVVKTALLR